MLCVTSVGPVCGFGVVSLRDFFGISGVTLRTVFCAWGLVFSEEDVVGFVALLLGGGGVFLGSWAGFTVGEVEGLAFGVMVFGGGFAVGVSWDLDLVLMFMLAISSGSVGNIALLLKSGFPFMKSSSFGTPLGGLFCLSRSLFSTPWSWILDKKSGTVCDSPGT